MKAQFFSRFRLVLALAAGLVCATTHAQIAVTDNQTAAQLVQKLLGTGVTTSNATLNCPGNANGIFVTASPGLPSNLGIDSGIVLTSGQANTNGFTTGVNANPALGGPGLGNGTGGDPDLTTLSGNNTFDACVLEFDFVPSGDTVKFDYVFGSTEYTGFSCTGFNDAFGFLITGPGYPTPTNIALVPGTTVPVSVNSTTDPVVNNVFNTAPCTAMGPGSPFANFYVDNLGDGGQVVSYPGFTMVFQAIAAVAACDTYHLKLAIADASDGALDSGVFLKAGSLSSVAIAVNSTGTSNLTINDQPLAVRGCDPGLFVISIPDALPDSLVISYIIGGSATNGVDYQPITNSVTLAPGATTQIIPIYALHTGDPSDSLIETVELQILSPYLCGNGEPSIIATAVVQIIDTLPLDILTPDTTICTNQCVPIDVAEIGNLDSFVSYYWTPTAGVSDPNIKEPVICPPNTGLPSYTYVLHSYITGSACDTSTDTIVINVQLPADVNAGPDVTTCLGTPVQLNATALPPSQPYSYNWQPPSAGSLNDLNIANPIYTPAAVGTFSLILTASPGAGGACEGSDTINIRVLPDDFNLYNNDTVICNGASVQINADADPAFAILWAPTTGVSNPVLINPLITPADTGSFTYTVTASYPTCPDIVKDITIQVEPSPTVTLGPDLVKCQWDTLQLHANVTPAGYPFYTYQWTPDSNLTALVSNGPTGSDPNATTDVVFSGQDTALIVFTVRTPAGCSAQDQLGITVYPGNFASLSPANDTGICPGDSVLLQASGGVMYEWTPGLYLNDSTVAAPTAYPQSDVHYTALVTDQYGCLDTLDIDIDVRPAAVLSLPDTVLLYPGDSIVMDPGGNCLYYQWFPYGGLSSPTVANPVVMPAVDTRYFVTASTEWGCVARDSVEVLVNEDSELDVPNAFAPGGSGSNKTIKPVHLGLASVSYFRIYNRWGTLVFSTADINEGWDGTHNGTPQPMGVYIYQVEGRTFKGRTVKKSGNVTLLR